jgi:hypothetical protein
MRSLKFPKMFGTNHTEVWLESEHKQATLQNIKLTLASVRGELLGDPYFGMLVHQYMYEQNSYVLRDIIADMVYTQIAIFIPQLNVTRQGITIFQNKKMGQLVCQIKGTNQIDYMPNTYELILFTESTI